MEGIVRPLLESWQQYQHGRASQQRDDAVETLKEERAIEDAVEDARRHPVDADADKLRDRIAQARAERERRAKGQ